MAWQIAANDFKQRNLVAQFTSSRIFLNVDSLSSSNQSPANQPNAQATSPKGGISEVRSFPLRCQIASVRSPFLFIGLVFAFGMCFFVRWGWEDWGAKPFAGLKHASRHWGYSVFCLVLNVVRP